MAVNHPLQRLACPSRENSPHASQELIPQSSIELPKQQKINTCASGGD
jgi:hypothetical protein